MAIRSSDQISIVDLTDGYSVMLTNDSHTFLGDTSKAIAASTQTTVIAMCGASQVAASVNLDDVVKPTGVNVTKDTDATQPTLTIAVTTAVTAGGVVDIPVQLDNGNITIHKLFTFQIAFKGSPGSNGSSAQWFTPHQIARSLTEKHIPTPRGGEIWCESTILSILRNERYKGDAILQKSFCTDFLTKKKKKNEGEVPQYYVRNSHPAIVSEEVYELVQLEIEARKEYSNRYSGKGLFASRIVCGDCGGFFGSKVWHSTDRYRRTIWRCNRKYESGAPKDQRCTTPHVTEFAIMDSFVRLMEHVIADKGMILASCQAILDEIMATDDMDQKIAKLQDQTAGLAQRIRGLVSQNARETRDQSKFQEEYEPLTRQYEALTKKIEGIQREKASKTSRAKRIRIFMGMLKEQEECLEFDPVLFAAFVEKVIVSGQKKEVVLTFILRDGSEHRIVG